MVFNCFSNCLIFYLWNTLDVPHLDCRELACAKAIQVLAACGSGSTERARGDLSAKLYEKKRKIKLINTVRDGSPPSIGPPRGPSQPIVQSEWSNGYWNRHAAQAGGKLGGCKFSSFRGLASKQRWWGSLLVVVGFGENCWFLFENCLAESWKKTLFKNGSFWNVRYLVFPFR